MSESWSRCPVGPCGRIASLVVTCLAVLAASASAQSSLAAGCGSPTSSQATACHLAVQLADIVPARASLAASGGNPTIGTASTLGIKLGSMPPISLGGRVSFARADVPTASGGSATGEDITALFLGADARVGLYSGLSPFATVGGLGSVDLMASLGVVKLPGDRFDSPVSWGLGARLGILRESFTAPGLSVSGMYRKLGGMTIDDVTELDGSSTWSLRFAIGKRLTPVGLTAGVGWDRTSTDATVAIPQPGSPPLQASGEVGGDGRFNAFADVSYTLVVLTVAAEVGWQGGGGATGVSGVSDHVGKGGLFGGLIFRLTL